ncbi:MAG TPA: PEGA domain-containing protein [Candidatus Dormibacteraeota bacterium]|jgi:hypothetical protein|nr:PEGA domain-containing protein [Candidatus Dormibacteraeota bacterium]
MGSFFRITAMMALLLACVMARAGEHKEYPVALKVIETDALSSKADGSRVTTTCTNTGSDSFTCDSEQVPGAQHTELVSFADPSDGKLYMITCVQGAGVGFAQGFAAGTGVATVTGCALPPSTYRARWDRGRLKVLHERNGKEREITFVVLSSTPLSAGNPRLQTSGMISEEAHLALSSVPPGAEISLDGDFVGQTPSSIPVSPGEHWIKITKTGYKQWERKIRTRGGEVTIAAQLELEQK